MDKPAASSPIAARAQDAARGMTWDGEALTLRRPVAWRPLPELDLALAARESRARIAAEKAAHGYVEPRDTLHFCLDGLVQNHSRGAFDGALVVCAPLFSMPPAASVHPDDAWWHVDASGSLRLPGAALLAPEGFDLPGDLDAMATRYPAPDPSADPEGFALARSRAVEAHMLSQGREPAPIGTAAIHMGSLSERMESALQRFQVEFGAALARGPADFALDAIDRARTGAGSEPAWLAKPAGVEGALAAHGAHVQSMLAELVRIEEAAARGAPGFHAQAAERLAERLAACRGALASHAEPLRDAAAAWGAALEARQPCEELAAPPSGLDHRGADAYWDWAQSRANALGRSPEGRPTLAAARARTLQGCLSPSAALACARMDGQPGCFPVFDAFASVFAPSNAALPELSGPGPAKLAGRDASRALSASPLSAPKPPASP